MALLFGSTFDLGTGQSKDGQRNEKVIKINDSNAQLLVDVYQ